MQVAGRLIVVCRADLTGRYNWIPPLRPDDVTIVLDSIAYKDLASRRPLLFDEMESWEERSAAQRRFTELLPAITGHPAVAAIEHGGHRLVDFADLRLHDEIARLLCGWRLARAWRGASELICDPGAPPALTMGVRAGLGIDPSPVSYAIPSALPGSRAKRALVRPLMRVLGACSRPEGVRVGAVVAGKLSLALASLSAAELHAAGVGVVPFPGLDHGNGALLAMRRRLPLLATYGVARVGLGPTVRVPTSLDIADPAELDRAMALLVHRLLTEAASEFDHALSTLAGLERARSLRALLLPSAAYGASRLLIGWAHQRGLQVASMQHGIYSLRDDYSEHMTDVLFGWGAGTTEQTSSWPDPQPRVSPVGLPGVAATRPRRAKHPPVANPSRVLIATTGLSGVPIVPATHCDAFIDVIGAGLARLAAAGVDLELRPHPSEDAARYRRLLDARQLTVRIVSKGSFSGNASRADIVIASTSSAAFEAAALGLPLLLWMGTAPQWIRTEHLLPPWTEHVPGTFQSSDDFGTLVTDLLMRPDRGFDLAYGLGCYLTRYAEPFRPDRFAAGLLEISAPARRRSRNRETA